MFVLISRSSWAEDIYSSEGEHWPSIFKALGSIPSITKTKQQKKCQLPICVPGVVGHAYNCSTQKVEAGEPQPQAAAAAAQLHIKTMRPCLKKTQKTRKHFLEKSTPVLEVCPFPGHLSFY